MTYSIHETRHTGCVVYVINLRCQYMKFSLFCRKSIVWRYNGFISVGVMFNVLMFSVHISRHKAVPHNRISFPFSFFIGISTNISVVVTAVFFVAILTNACCVIIVFTIQFVLGSEIKLFVKFSLENILSKLYGRKNVLSM